jgi:outer membrane immunogenic protein
MEALRIWLIGSAVALTALAAAAMPAAADKAPGPSYRTYQPPIWQGLYGGVHLGWGESGPADGVVGGAQIGYNWRSGQIVYGLEADVSAADISYEENIFGVRAEASIDWLATARGRLGFLVAPRILAYATAGFGIASASASAGIPGLGSLSIDDTETDFVYGLGVEAKVTDATSFRLEYIAFSDLDIDVVRAGVNFKLGY